MTYVLEGLVGGSTTSNNSTTSNHSYGNGNGNSKRNQKTEKTQISIFKYTARFKKPLHEAILLAGYEPFLLTWNEQKQVWLIDKPKMYCKYLLVVLISEVSGVDSEYPDFVRQ